MSRFITPPAFATRNPQRWLEYGRLAALPLAILPIPPDSPLAASPTGRARLESPFRAGLMFEFVPHQKAPPFAGELSVSDSEQTEGELLAAVGCFKLFSYQKAPQVGEPMSQLFFRRSRFYSSSIFFANITLIMFIMPSTIMQTPITVVAAAALFMGLNSITMPAASIMNANTITSI